MWGRLSLSHHNITDKSKSVTIFTLPTYIELDISKSTHYIGRIANPDESKFQHKVQHGLPLPFLSGTHCSISRKVDELKNITYIITDYSANGTYVKKCSQSSSTKSHDTADFDSLKPIGFSKSVEISDNDQIVFKLINTKNVVCYTFHSLFSLPEVYSGIILEPSSSSSSGGQHSTSASSQSQPHIYETQINNLKSEILSLETRIAADIKAIEGLQKENIAYERDVSLLNEKIVNFQKEISKLTDQLRAIESNLSATEANNRKLKDTIDDHTSKHSELLLKYNNTVQDMTFNASQVSHRDAVINELTVSKTDETKKRQELQRKYDGLIQQLETEKEKNSLLTDGSLGFQILVRDQEIEIDALKVGVRWVKYNIYVCMY